MAYKCIEFNISFSAFLFSISFFNFEICRRVKSLLKNTFFNVIESLNGMAYLRTSSTTISVGIIDAKILLEAKTLLFLSFLSYKTG